MKKLLVCLALLALAPGGTTGMVLTRESFSNGAPGSDMSQLPTWCYHEDSFHTRTWSGTLAAGASFTTTARFCTTDEAPPYGPGPEGFRYAVWFATKQSVSLSVTFPDGSVRAAWPFNGFLDGCVVPQMYEATGRYIDNIDSGIYTVTLTNTGSRDIRPQEPLTLQVRADFIDVNFQQTLCPPEDRRLV